MKAQRTFHTHTRTVYTTGTVEVEYRTVLYFKIIISKLNLYTGTGIYRTAGTCTVYQYIYDRVLVYASKRKIRIIKKETVPLLLQESIGQGHIEPE